MVGMWTKEGLMKWRRCAKLGIAGFLWGDLVPLPLLAQNLGGSTGSLIIHIPYII